MKKPEGKRSDRVAERLRAELAELAIRGRLRDPRVKELVISGVHVTDDLQQARVYVRLLREVDERRRRGVVEALTRAAGFLRRELAPRLELRRVPELSFFWDDHIDRIDRLEHVFDELKRESSAKEDE
ncbi:MAG: 30S ribosome-binding factor RbfA [Myxococcota bacterium]